MPDKKLNILFLLPPNHARESAYPYILKTRRPENYLFYGMDYLHRKGDQVHTNIGVRNHRVVHTIIWQMYSKLFAKIVGYAGNLNWLLPVMGDIRKADVIVAVSGNIAFALAFMRMAGVIPRKRIIFISIGLPEQLVQMRNLFWRRKVIAEFNKNYRIIMLSKKEADVTKSEYGISTAIFLPAGVDVDVFSPKQANEDVDVLSIGADRYRDYELLLQCADDLPELSFRIITSESMANDFKNIPGNVKVLCDIPMTDIPEQLSKGKVVVLPVKDNSYSGATTVLLQAMSMGKAVIANPIGANKEGYPFKTGENCLMIEPGNMMGLIEKIRYLIADEKARKTIGDSARRTCVEYLNIQEFHKHLEAIIKD